MKKILFLIPVLAFLVACEKETETPKPQKAYVTEVKINKFPTTDGGKAWDANATSTSATAPDVYFEVVNTDAAKTILKARNTVKYADNVTLTNLPKFTIDPKLELPSLTSNVSFVFYDQDSGILDSNDDLMGSCTLDMAKESVGYPKEITVDNGAGFSITFAIEYVY